MTYQEELQALRTKIARQKQLLAVQKELHDQMHELEQKLYSLRAAHRAEEMDVELLEGRSLTALFYAIIGRRAEKLDTERREAWAAQLKCEVAEQEIAEVKSQLLTVNDELAQLNGCTNRYEVLINLRREELRTSGTPDGEEMLRLEERLAASEHMHREILEALTAAKRALSTAWSIDSTLEKAKDLGVWDMLGGGSFVTWEKHAQLDGAQNQIAILQEQLRSLKTELADVKVQADLQVNIGGFMRFADYFFDDLFTDWAVQDHIKSSLTQIGEVRHALDRVVEQLEKMQKANEEELTIGKVQLRLLLERTDLT